MHATLAQEVADCAISAATKDPRFIPLTLNQLDNSVMEISLLDQPEEITNVSELDPRRYGVIVSRDEKKGVLLPDLDGVDVVEQQLAIAKRKAGIRADEKIKIQRFSVTKIKEQ
jgi:AMMECR1 domain-containing protein